MILANIVSWAYLHLGDSPYSGVEYSLPRYVLAPMQSLAVKDILPVLLQRNTSINLFPVYQGLRRVDDIYSLRFSILKKENLFLLFTLLSVSQAL